ncbi:hypothetical protein SLEP1_g50377 [Rubroshorea leprosula]|uniref:Transmembrane protein n=1 Tax=Rubroshorea leprosula TaxID=152421 RepID=A0AAV5M020_9ROSI|nr:hypothetical protein SLEP1_g50377 [Rubroshorea leprosula]
MHKEKRTNIHRSCAVGACLGVVAVVAAMRAAPTHFWSGLDRLRKGQRDEREKGGRRRITNIHRSYAVGACLGVVAVVAAMRAAPTHFWVRARQIKEGAEG